MNKSLLVTLCFLFSFSTYGFEADSLTLKEIQSIEKRIDLKLTEIDKEFEKIKNAKKKDNWDIVSIISGFFSSVIIAGLGIYFTWNYRKIQEEKEAAINLQQLKVKEVEIVEKFIPYLTGTEEQQEYSILAIKALGNTDLALELTTLYRSKGAVNALSKIEKTSSEPDRVKAQNALSIMFDSLKYSIVKIKSDGKFIGSGFYISDQGHALSMNYMLDGSMGDISLENYGGTIPQITNLEFSADNTGLGLIHTSQNNTSPLTLSNDKVSLNQQVFISGFTDSRTSMFHYSGEVVGIGEDEFEVTANIPLNGIGLGGSPVFDNQGMLIGVLSASYRDGAAFIMKSTSLIKSKIDSIENSSQQTI